MSCTDTQSDCCINVELSDEVVEVTTAADAPVQVTQEADECIQVSTTDAPVQVTQEADECIQVTVSDVACPGVPIAPADNGTIIVEFNHETPSPLIISIVAAGSWLLDAEINIDESFDDPLATVSLGSSSDNDQFIAADEVRPNVATYGVGDEGNFKFSGPDIIYLFIEPGSSTQGAGNVQILVQL